MNCFDTRCAEPAHTSAAFSLEGGLQLAGHPCPCLFGRHCSYSFVLALPMPVTIATMALAHSVFVMGICTPPTLCPPEVYAHVVVFAPMLLSFSYFLESLIVPGSSYIFPVLILESFIFPRSLCSFY